MVSLSEIIKESVSFINYQLNDEYDKYDIETHLKWIRNDRNFPNNIMSEILNKWGVDEQKIILILSYHHDSDTIAYEFESIDELEDKLKHSFYHLHSFITYVIPIVKGKVKPFKIFDENNKEIIKEYFDLDYKEYYDNLRIEWD